MSSIAISMSFPHGRRLHIRTRLEMRRGFRTDQWQFSRQEGTTGAVCTLLLGRRSPCIRLQFNHTKGWEDVMEFTSEKIERTRNNIIQTEQRILRQRRRVEKMLVERHPADEAQAQLLIMEQSLLAMTRFLKNLERDLELDDRGAQRNQTSKRIRPAKAGSDTAKDVLTANSPEPSVNHS